MTTAGAVVHVLGQALLCSVYQASGGSEFATGELDLVTCAECRARVVAAEVAGRWRAS